MPSALTESVWSEPPSSGATIDPREVIELKAWCRRAWWAEHASLRGRARALVKISKAPWRFVREAARVAPRHGPFVARQFGTPMSRQLLRMTWARFRYGISPTSFYRFQLFRPAHWKNVDRYMQTRDVGRVLRWLVAQTPGYGSVFGDKRAFEAWCVENGLPTVRTVMEFDGGRLVRGLSPDGLPPRVDLFSKPSNSQGGDGTVRWIYRPDGSYVASDGRVVDAEGVMAALARMSTDLGRPILVQPVLRNAACDAPLTPGGLATARLTTARLPGGEPHLIFAVLRMPADAASAADNFASGGLASPIDLHTGRLLAAVRKDFAHHAEPIDRHPRTGAQIVGHQLPHWREAMSLAMRAHRAVTWKGVPVVGWDVALLEEGPLLIEGNNVPCSTFAQMVLEQPLGDSPVVACVNAHLRERFGHSPVRG